MAAAFPAATLDEFAPRPVGRRALVSLASAALRARSRLGAAPSGAPRAESASLADGRARVRPSAGQGDRRDADPALGAQPAAARAASARGRLAPRRRWLFLLLRRAAADGGGGLFALLLGEPHFHLAE